LNRIAPGKGRRQGEDQTMTGSRKRSYFHGVKKTEARLRVAQHRNKTRASVNSNLAAQ